MRFVLAGILLGCIWATSALAQAGAEGEVESIGFEGNYRPNCWTPIKIKLSPRTGQARTYRIAVSQEDLDKDKVTFSRPFTLSGNPEGQKIEERVWAYYRPQPFGMDRPQDLKIFLYNEKNEQEVIIKVPPSVNLFNLDETNLHNRPGKRFVLLVGTSQNKPIDPYLLGPSLTPGRSDLGDLPRGMNEEVQFHPVRPSDLPSDSKGYECVDAIVWLDGDAKQLPPASQSAIEDWVRDGGNLVVCQPEAWQATKESFLGPLLPVDIQRMGEEEGLKSLNALVKSVLSRDGEWLDFPKARQELREGKQLSISPPWLVVARNPTTGVASQVLRDPWESQRGSKQAIAKATLRRGAIAVHACADDPSSPYLARWLVGVGSVTWVAQDLGSPSVVPRADGLSFTMPGMTGQDIIRLGWAQVWDRVFDWPNRTISSERVLFVGGQGIRQEYESYSPANPSASDLSRSLLDPMEHAGRGAGYVAIAVLFFVGYWVVAGPGSYFFLAARKRTHYSWITFAACAGVATLLTMGIVKVVLRGAPEVKHVTFVRVAPSGEAVAHSNFGLYIPRDGMQEIELKETLPKRSSYVTPYPMHPAHLPDQSQGGFVSYLEYDVPVRDRSSTEPPIVSVPYRSTLKKFQAKWVGQLKGTITGRARISGDSRVSGRLVNETGVDLHSVYLVYLPSLEPEGRDPMMLNIIDLNSQPAWPAGAVLDLQGLEDRLDAIRENQGSLAGKIGYAGRLNARWSQYQFQSSLKKRGFDGDDYREEDRGALLMTVFDLLTPSRILSQHDTRYELRRRAGRHLDASEAVNTGHLLIFGRSMKDEATLPFTMRVAGDEPVASAGTVYWQIIVPMDRPTPAAATQPSDLPNSRPTPQPVEVETR